MSPIYAGSSSRTTEFSSEDGILSSDIKGSYSFQSVSATTDSSTGRTSRMRSSNNPAGLCVDETTGNSSMDETVMSATPEDLRQQALDERKKYKILKGEGKNDEALKAFKRGKELERQAHALEMDLRKSQRKVSPSIGDNKGQNIVAAEGSQRLRNQLPKDDLMSELRQMGWSDKDIENEGKQLKNVSVEGELLALIGEVSEKKKPNESSSSAKTEITVHKRKAILLKKEGKIAEAKEELKKAKILERQAEEQELLGGADDYDDEFADLIRSMDSEKEDFNVMSSMQDFDMGIILPDIDNLAESNFEVTEDDMEDPELAGALQSLGWTEEPQVVVGSKSSSGITPRENEASYNGAAAAAAVKRESYHPSSRTKTKAELQRELLGLKRKAFGLRREGKTEEAEEVQKMAKALEDEIAELDTLKKKPIEHIDVVENSEVIDDTEVTENDLQDPALLGMLNDLGWKEEDHGGRPVSQTLVTASSSEVAVPRSKSVVQREVLRLKRKALELRRKGEMVEAEEVSNKAKVLQAELEELDATKEDLPPNNDTAENKSGVVTESNAVKKASTEEDVSVIIKGGIVTENADLFRKAADVSATNSGVEVVHHSALKQEISDHQKRALALKRQGKLAEAKEELIKAKLLKRSLDEEVSENNPEPTVSMSSSSASTTTILQEKESDPLHASLPTAQTSSNPIPVPPTKPLSSRERYKIQQESLSHKRQAMKLRREGRTQEAEAEFELAKALEAKLEEHHSSTQSNSDDVMVEDFLDPQLLSALKAIGIGGGNDNGPSTSTEKLATAAAPAKVSSAGSTEKVQLEEEIKAERVKAVRFKRAGQQKDALEALKRAKLLERKLSEFH